MSDHDHEGRLKTNQENSFVTLHEKIDALKQYINVFIYEPQKFDQEDYNKLVKDVDDVETDCKDQVDAYTQHLEDNVAMHRRSIAETGAS